MTPVYVVGVGLEGKESLLSSTKTLIDSADIVVAGHRLMNLFSPDTAEQWFLEDYIRTFERVNSYIDQHPAAQVVILATGDPLYFGIGRMILTYIAREKVTFIPNLSSIQLAFSRIKMPWQDAAMVSVHGRSFEHLLQYVRKGTPKIAVLTDPSHSPAAIATSIIALDIPIPYQAWVCENLGAEDEHIECLELEALQQKVFSPLTALILVRQSSLADFDLSQLPVMGIADHYFYSFEDRPGLMTKREVRLLALGELALQPHHICWDIGAGTGSMSIEMARLAPHGNVYAVEKSAAGVMLINKNKEHFSTINLQSVQGEAPNVLNELPKPNRIFLGGSGRKLRDILVTCTKYLLPQGRIVLAIATFETLNEALTCLREWQWQTKILHVQLAKSLPIADLTRLNPLNPVFLVTAEPPLKTN